MQELLINTTTVQAGGTSGTTSPSAGTAETWTVTGTLNTWAFVCPALVPAPQFRMLDEKDLLKTGSYELIMVTNTYATTLTVALTSGTAYTALAVGALPAPVNTGDILCVSNGTEYQMVTVSTGAAAGATSIAVDSFTANAAYATGSTVGDTTNLGANTTWVVTRGVENTVPYAHTTGAYFVPAWTAGGVLSSTQPPVTTLSDATTLTGPGVYICSAANGAFTVTLPAPSAWNRYTIALRKNGTDSNVVTVSGSIDGASIPGALSVPGDALDLVSDGTTWHIVSAVQGPLVFNTSQNWTVPAGWHFIHIILQGGHGGGGGASACSTTQSCVGGSAGGSGAALIVENWQPGPPGTSIQFTIGAGGAGGAGAVAGTTAGNGALGGGSYASWSANTLYAQGGMGGIGSSTGGSWLPGGVAGQGGSGFSENGGPPTQSWMFGQGGLADIYRGETGGAPGYGVSGGGAAGMPVNSGVTTGENGGGAGTLITTGAQAGGASGTTTVGGNGENGVSGPGGGGGAGPVGGTGGNGGNGGSGQVTIWRLS